MVWIRYITIENGLIILLRILIVTVLGLGKIRPAPGSWGSLPPCVLAGLLLYYEVDSWVVQVVLGVVVLAASVGCVALGSWAEEHYHGKDPGVVVIDEVAGMGLALMFLPSVLPSSTGDGGSVLSGYLIILGAYILFRIFDIVKIQPANVMQQFPGGWGILLDDAVAGLYANLFLQIALRVVLPWLIMSS